MHVTREQKTPTQSHLVVTATAEDLQPIKNHVLSHFRKSTKVPGFRPGKAPRKVIEKRFRKEVTDQVKAEVLLQSLEQLAEDHDVAPLSAPNLDPTKIEIAGASIAPIVGAPRRGRIGVV